MIRKGISIAPGVVVFFLKCQLSDNLLIAVTPKREKHKSQDFEKIFHLFPYFER